MCLLLLFDVTAQGNGVLCVLVDDLLHKRHAQGCCMAVLSSAYIHACFIGCRECTRQKEKVMHASYQVVLAWTAPQK